MRGAFALIIAVLLCCTLAAADLLVYVGGSFNSDGIGVPLLPPSGRVFPLNLQVGKLSRLWGNSISMITLQPDGLITTSCNMSAFGPPCGGPENPKFSGQFMIPSSPWQVSEACTITFADYVKELSYVEYVCLNSTGPAVYHDAKLVYQFQNSAKLHEDHIRSYVNNS